MNKSLLTLALMALLPLAQAWAAEGNSEQQAREKARAAVVAAEANGSNKPVTLEEPARRYYDWGAVLNKSFEVMAVTPGSDAAEMGLKKGDVLLSVNGDLTQHKKLGDVLAKINDLDDGQPLTVTMQRGKDKLSFSTKVHAKVMPAWRLEISPKDSANKETAVAAGQCGRVSVFFTPPQAHDQYPAYVNAIDGKGVVRSISVFKLPAGKHTIALHELITDYRLARRGGGMEMAKKVTINVEPNTIYYLAAQFLPENRFKTFKDQYWEPVVWRIDKKPCS
ncbi:PDZ domain-containing protein [Gallaecimonas mangrovi]|uniref:PDZ domain-containing protein n=1 Tax=Gallaecimonas mangrovi TaxID=2291597 RepID=UPI000E201719|nr:PDZ domain-containing protein [Gallaecimonas mangrovi]